MTKAAIKIPGMIKLDFLYKCCTAEISQFMSQLGGEVFGKEGAQYAFKDNGADILAVAHLDTVQKDAEHLARVRLKHETLVFNPKLDDRLGVYAILHTLPFMGIKADILFTENEEKSKSTAADFVATKSYNWIVEFDRQGTDAVTYCYDWQDLVRKYFKVGYGSFSDISNLEHLGCKALNVGIGYHEPHSERAYFVIGEYISQMIRFARFYRDNKATRFPHEPAPLWRHYDYEFLYDDCVICEECGYSFYEDEMFFTGTSPHCPYCGNKINSNETLKKESVK